MNKTIKFDYNQNNIMLRIAYISFLVIVLILIIASVKLSTITFDNNVKEFIIYKKSVIDDYRKSLGNYSINDYEAIKKIKDDTEKENRLNFYNGKKQSEISNLTSANTTLQNEINKITNIDIPAIETSKEELKNFKTQYPNLKTESEINAEILRITDLDGMNFDEKVTEINKLRRILTLINSNFQEEIDKLDSDKTIKDNQMTENSNKITSLENEKFSNDQITDFKNFFNLIKDKNLGNYVFLTENEYKQFIDGKLSNNETLEKLSENQRIYLSSIDPIDTYLLGFSSVFLIAFILSNLYLFLTIGDYQNATTVIGFFLTIFAFWITYTIETNGQKMTEKDNQIVGNIIGWSMIPILFVMIFNRAINEYGNEYLFMFLSLLCLLCLTLMFSFDKSIREGSVKWNDNFIGVIVAFCLFFVYFIWSYGLLGMVKSFVWRYLNEIITIISLGLFILFSFMADKYKDDSNQMILNTFWACLFCLIFLISSFLVLNPTREKFEHLRGSVNDTRRNFLSGVYDVFKQNKHLMLFILTIGSMFGFILTTSRAMSEENKKEGKIVFNEYFIGTIVFGLFIIISLGYFCYNAGRIFNY